MEEAVNTPESLASCSKSEMQDLAYPGARRYWLEVYRMSRAELIEKILANERAARAQVRR